ncbi:hypothetical protein [Neobacillus vireti]|uniref:Uncharacterized protein n=1 Tax=Neobacillus vireti LMG 21834 TaxID=1131730 RepID=A0AB94IUH2_9BACI|nr:hypothetical protein [Neobacillus vireti]ETI70734.1 hypothetical protein BAVI_00945 [Neobacillus vireti LMG 21834]KLT18792.1 hypothetical protein AA980_07030 [Neobacillus vireti]
MNQFFSGFLLVIFLALPPVAHLLESIMIVHMHMQMPLLVIAGFLMARLFQLRFPRFFEKWNGNGIPGILLFLIIIVFWTIPRSMDEALNFQSMEIFKFFSLSILAGIPLRDSWKKLSSFGKNAVIIIFTIKYFGMGLLYIKAPVQLCNNYLIMDQLTLGWGFLTTAICLVIYLLYVTFTDPTKYQ